MTVLPRLRNSSAISQPRLAWASSMVEIMTRSTSSSKSTVWTFSSVRLTSCSSGIWEAIVMTPRGGRMYLVW